MGRRRVTKISKLEDLLNVRFRNIPAVDIVNLIFSRFDLKGIFIRCPYYNNVLHAKVCVYRRFVSKPKRMCRKCEKILDVLLNMGEK